MADQKISALTAQTTLSDDDLFVVVDDPAGSATTKKMAASDVKSNLKSYNDTLYAAQNYLTGLKLSNNATDATNDIDIAKGQAMDSTNTGMMTLASTLTKQLDAAWSVGTGAGGLDQGSIANATYHVHAIKRVDTSVVDAIYSLSHDKSATVTMTIASPAVVTWGVAGKGHGLVAGSPFKFSTTGALPTGVTAGTQYYVISTGLTETTFQFSASNGGSAVNSSGSQSGTHTGLPGPKMPTNYTLFRRIGSIVRTGAAIKTFVQDGDDFRWLVPVLDVNSTNPGTSAVTRTLTLPVGIRINAMLSSVALGSGASADNPAAVFISDLSITDSTPSTTFNSIFSFTGFAGATQTGGFVQCYTNSGAQVRSRVQISTAGTVLYITTHGWKDTRGKDG
jgi:hypothetical protein